MKMYEIPEIKVELFKVDDIIATSTGNENEGPLA